MATNWPVLSRKMDWGSSISRTPQVDLNNFGDGYVARYPLGINNLPGTFNIVYGNLSQADFNILVPFIKTHAALSTDLIIPLYPEDISGNTTGIFFIKSYNVSTDMLPTVTLTCEEIYGR